MTEQSARREIEMQHVSLAVVFRKEAGAGVRDSANPQPLGSTAVQFCTSQTSRCFVESNQPVTVHLLTVSVSDLKYSLSAEGNTNCRACEAAGSSGFWLEARLAVGSAVLDYRK